MRETGFHLAGNQQEELPGRSCGNLQERVVPVLLFASMMTFVIQYGGFLTFLPFYLEQATALHP
jgi:hypothetical protein